MAQGLNNLIKKYYRKEGDNEMFSDILECCSCEIKSSIAWYQKKYRDAMEQEARIKIYELLENHKLDKVLDTSDEDISSYLKRAVDNRLRDFLRKDCKCSKHEYSLPVNELENLGGILVGITELKISLEEAFNEIIKILTKKQKEVMTLIYLEELKEEEIAKILHVKRQDINALKNRAKKAIKANLTLNTYGVDQTPLYEAVI